VPLVLAEVELPVGFIPAFIPLEQSLRLGLLAGLHSLGNNVGKPALANHPQDVLAIELPVHQHVIDLNEILSRIQQVLDDFQSCLPLSNGACVQHSRDGIPDQLDRRPLIVVFIGTLFCPGDSIFMTGPFASGRVGLSNLNGDDTGAEELLCLCDLVDEVPGCLPVYLSTLFDREVSDVVAVSVPEWRPLPC
jgi:hypothetical protein